MHKLKFLLLIAAISLLSSVKVNATHVMGSDIQWECVGKDSFKIIVTVYRDCNGVPLGRTPINVSSNCGSARLTTQMSGGQDITPVCDEQCTLLPVKG